MPTERIVLELVNACTDIRREMERGAYRKAAKSACVSLRVLAKDRPTFWANLDSTLAPLQNNQEMIGKVLEYLAEFVELEGEILSNLGVDDAEANPILAEVFGSIDLTAAVPDYLTGRALARLQPDVENAAELICKHSSGAIRRGLDILFSKKALKALSAGAISAANMGVIHIPHFVMPHLSPSLEPLKPWLAGTSANIGGLILGKEAKEISEAFFPKER